MATANGDLTGLNVALFRDGDTATCNTIPHLGEGRGFLKTQFFWPVLNTPNPNYKISIVGIGLLCGENATNELMVYMRVSISLPEPSFFGDFIACDYESQSVTGSLISCVYECNPAPEYSEAVFVHVQASATVSRKLCEVRYIV